MPLISPSQNKQALFQATDAFAPVPLWLCLQTIQDSVMNPHQTPLVRKLCTWALCLLMSQPTGSVDMASEQALVDLKEKFDDACGGGGRVQINSMPFRLKQRLASKDGQQVSSLLHKMKTRSYMVDTTRQIWCYPDFKRLPDSDPAISESESDESGPEVTLEDVKSIRDFELAFPDPLYFSVGVFMSAEKAKHRRLKTTLCGEVIET